MRIAYYIVSFSVLTGVLFTIGCGSNRQVASPMGTTVSTGNNQTVSTEKNQDGYDPAITPTIPALAVDDRDLIDLLIDESEQLFAAGKRLVEEGKIDEARLLFQRALDTLKDSSFEFALNPELERAYYVLLGEIQELEFEALAGPVNRPVPSWELTPLDILADLDLFMIEVDPALKELVSQDLLQTRFDIPVVLNDNVLRFLNYYQTRGRKIMLEGLRRSGKYLRLLQDVFREEGLPADLVYMAHVESLFKPHAYSRARARGIWQFIAGTGRKYGLRQDWWIDERSDIVKSTRAAARYLKDLYDQFQDWHLAMAAYNVGENRIERNLRRYGPMDYWSMVDKRLLPLETRRFVPSILAAVIIFRHPELYGFHVEPEEELQFVSVALEDQLDLSVVAEMIDIPLAKLHELNPELRRGITPFDYPGYQLKIPVGKVDLLKRKLASLPPEKRVRFRHHEVRRGETLSVIASRYTVSVQAIAQVNRIRNVHRIREGQDLIIPLTGSTRGLSSSVRAAQALPTSHIVRRGDSLAKIARRYGVTIGDLLRWNDLTRKNLIYPGQRIRILAEAKSTHGDRAGGGQ